MRHIYESVGEDDAVKETVSDLIAKRDKDAIQTLGAKSSPLVLALMSLEGNLEGAQNTMRGLKLFVCCNGHAKITERCARAKGFGSL